MKVPIELRPIATPGQLSLNQQYICLREESLSFNKYNKPNFKNIIMAFRSHPIIITS